MDWYVTAFALLSGAFIEATMIANIYGKYKTLFNDDSCPKEAMSVLNAFKYKSYHPKIYVYGNCCKDVKMLLYI